MNFRQLFSNIFSTYPQPCIPPNARRQPAALAAIIHRMIAFVCSSVALLYSREEDLMNHLRMCAEETERLRMVYLFFIGHNNIGRFSLHKA